MLALTVVTPPGRAEGYQQVQVGVPQRGPEVVCPGVLEEVFQLAQEAAFQQVQGVACLLDRAVACRRGLEAVYPQVPEEVFQLAQAVDSRPVRPRAT